MPRARAGRAQRRAEASFSMLDAVCLGACGDGEAQASPDPSGERIVSLVPAGSGIVAALGAGDLLVGRTRDDRTPSLAHLPTVGRVLSPDPERIVALRPTLVLAWARADLRALDAAMHATDGRVLPLRLDRLGDVAPTVRALADELGRGPEGRRLATEIERRLEAVRASVRGRPAPRVLWVVWAEPPVVAGPGTLPDDLLETVGARNLFADAPTPWPRPSREALLARVPDVVVWPTGPGVPDPETLPAGSIWRSWPRARLEPVDPDLVHEAGARVARAAETLAEVVHPSPDSPIPRPTPLRPGGSPP